MNCEFLIIGQGICGSWLSYWLNREKRTFLVMDDNAPGTPSRISAGVINPVTGRRYVSVWMADELLPFAFTHYQEWGKLLGIEAISEKKLIDFFPNPQMRESFVKRISDYGNFVHLPTDENDFRNDFSYDLGYGYVTPAYTAHLESILPAWRKYLFEEEKLRDEQFEISALEVIKGEIKYKDIRAEQIIFCEGNGGNINPFFSPLPFALNKGELLEAFIPGLPSENIYKKTIALVPLAEKDRWWIGSNYSWDYQDDLPTASFREQTESQLRKWLKRPFEITGHFAGLRPATIERRPFVGSHPLHSRIAILNGMGSKGASLAPYFAKQLADHLIHGKPILPEADIKRFNRLLSRTV